MTEALRLIVDKSLGEYVSDVVWRRIGQAIVIVFMTFGYSITCEGVTLQEPSNKCKSENRLRHCANGNIFVDPSRSMFGRLEDRRWFLADKRRCRGLPLRVLGLPN